MLRASLSALLLTHLAAPQSSAQRTLRDYLLGRAGFSEEDLVALESGEVVAKLRPGRVASETRLLGVVKIAGRPEAFIERYRDIVEFEKGAGILEIGIFGESPRVEDLEGLGFDAEDIEDVKRCRPGQCDLKMSVPMMEAFQSIDWARANATERAQALARRMVVDFLESYQRGGNEALGELHDKKQPFRVRKQFTEMLQDSDLPVTFPRLFEFLLEYPHEPIPGTEDFFYWSKVDFGLKPIIRLNHVVIYEPDTIDVVRYAIASKMLYASHYFNTGLELKFLVVDENQPDHFYLVAAQSSHSDGLTGFTGALLGGRLREKAREGLESYLQSVKQSLERRETGERQSLLRPFRPHPKSMKMRRGDCSTSGDCPQFPIRR